MAVGIRHADYATPAYLKNLALTSPASGGRSIGIVYSRAKATGLLLYMQIWHCAQNSKRYRIVVSKLCTYSIQRTANKTGWSTLRVHKVSFPLVPQLANLILREATAHT
jgi:hypothetical protein